MMVRAGWFVGLFVAAALRAALAQSPPEGAPPLDGRDGRPLALDQFRPRSLLQVDAHPPTRARFPAVDVHVHPTVRLHDSPAALDQFVRLMDQHQIALCVSLDGGSGEDFSRHRDFLWTRHRTRFVIFAGIDWRGSGRDGEPASWDCHRPDFARRAAAELARCKDLGASGLKVFKELGLGHRNPDGSLIRVDEERWDPIWRACGELGLPVLIHTADPLAFFQPVDATNERWEELRRHPDWSFARPGYPSHAELTAALLRVVARHRKTTFIAAHLANSGEDLRTLGRWLDEHPNLYVDLAARIAELGRQPITARKFLLRYADRILLGTDGPRVHERLVAHWRFLETEDEYFRYAETPFPPQGFWNIYGVNLPDEVLKKIYSANAIRLIPGVRERMAGK